MLITRERDRDHEKRAFTKVEHAYGLQGVQVWLDTPSLIALTLHSLVTRNPASYTIWIFFKR